MPTSITFEEGKHFKLNGKAKESGNKFTKYDNVFGMNLTKFAGKAIFTQRVDVTDASLPISGYVTFMVCNDEMCLPPKDADFKFVLPAAAAKPATDAPKKDEKTETPAPPPATTDGDAGGDTGAAPPPADADAGTSAEASGDANFQGNFDSKRAINPNEYVNACAAEVEETSSAWWVFIAGFLGGLVALLTPCVFPMIPLTVSFFTKRSRDRATGLRNALWYSSSIVLIYVGIGILLTSIFGPSILNEMSTDMYFNLLFLWYSWCLRCRFSACSKSRSPLRG
ncbi:MAG: hypothetical protein IPM98_13800 [Lewinellaceae bacterium]|nr:hypothetical protein [Lewinellaceae bacterium]